MEILERIGIRTESIVEALISFSLFSAATSAVCLYAGLGLVDLVKAIFEDMPTRDPGAGAAIGD